jgi:SAM-dependent methyltransferase
MDPQKDELALDIGCGLGKQLVPMTEKVSHITGLEFSKELLEKLKTSLGDRPHVRLIAGSMDDLETLLPSERFDLVYSCYALYYSKDIAACVGQIASRLKPGGRFFAVAPDVGNNETWFNDLQALFPLPAEILKSSWISRRQILPAMLANFPRVSCHKFSNEVAFATLDDLMKYYDGCGAYCSPAQRATAETHFRAIFDAKGKYLMEKRALGMIGFLEG